MVRQVTKYPILSLLGIFLAEHNSDFFLIQIKGLEHLLCSGFYNIQLFRKKFIWVFAQVLEISEYCFIKLSNLNERRSHSQNGYNKKWNCFFFFFFECLKIGKKFCKNVKPYWENSVKFLFLKKVIKYGFFCKCCVEFEDIRMRRKFTIAWRNSLWMPNNECHCEMWNPFRCNYAKE